MKKIINLWRAYAISYAIGYMMFLRPIANSEIVNVLFYVSLVIFSTFNYFSAKK